MEMETVDETGRETARGPGDSGGELRLIVSCVWQEWSKKRKKEIREKDFDLIQNLRDCAGREKKRKAGRFQRKFIRIF